MNNSYHSDSDEIHDGQTPAKRRRKKIIFDKHIHTTTVWKSKEFGADFDRLIEDRAASELVICKIATCRSIFHKGSSNWQRQHTKSHLIVQRPSKEAVDEVVVSSTQAFSIVSNASFQKFLECFQKFTIESVETDSIVAVRDLLPSPNIMSTRIGASMVEANVELMEKVRHLKASGGEITIDYAKNHVDYIALTGHLSTTTGWKKEDLILLFSPLSPNLTKTSENVATLVHEELHKLGVSDNGFSHFFVTTDEGSNVNSISGRNHMPCMCHVGATIAERTTEIYKYSNLSNQTKEMCNSMATKLKRLKKLIGLRRRDDNIRAAAGRALKMQAETRWTSKHVMVRALLDNLNDLRTATAQFAPDRTTPNTLIEMASDTSFSDYLSILKPTADMVLELQAEREHTSNKILLHIATIWISLLARRSPNNCVLCLSLAEAALECFDKKIGDFTQNWVDSTSGVLNKPLVLCAAFLDPFVHSQLKSMCNPVRGLSYVKIKKVVYEQARLLTPQNLVVQSTSNRQAIFARAQPTALDDQLNTYISLPVCDTDPLTFLRLNEKYFTQPAPLTEKCLAGQGSSSSSERAFKELRGVVGDFTRNRLDTKKAAALIHLRSKFIKETV